MRGRKGVVALISIFLSGFFLAGCLKEYAKLEEYIKKYISIEKPVSIEVSEVKREKSETSLELSYGTDKIVVTGKITNNDEADKNLYFSSFKLRDDKGKIFKAQIGSTQNPFSVIGTPTTAPLLKAHQSANFRLTFFGDSISKPDKLIFDDPTAGYLQIDLSRVPGVRP